MTLLRSKDSRTPRRRLRRSTNLKFKKLLKKMTSPMKLTRLTLVLRRSRSRRPSSKKSGLTRSQPSKMLESKTLLESKSKRRRRMRSKLKCL